MNGPAIKEFESLFSSRSIYIFKSDTRTSVHVDVEGTEKTLVFIAKDNGAFYHYMEVHWHPDQWTWDERFIV